MIILRFFFMFAFFLFVLPHCAKSEIHPIYHLMPQFEINLYSVKVKKDENTQPEWMWWHEALEQNLVSKIVDFGDPNWILTNEAVAPEQKELFQHRLLFLPETLNKVEAAILFRFWEKETINAVLEENREPRYLAAITNALALKVQNFVLENEAQFTSRSSLPRLFYAMIVYYQTAFLAAKESSDNATWNALSDAEKSYGLGVFVDFLDVSGRFGELYMDWHQAYSHSFSGITSYFGISDSWDTEACTKGGTFPEGNTIAYRIAEKVSLLYFLKNFDDIMKRCFNTSLNYYQNELSPEMFDSAISWKIIKSDFYILGQESRIFIEPWMTELDKLISKFEH